MYYSHIAPSLTLSLFFLPVTIHILRLRILGKQKTSIKKTIVKIMAVANFVCCMILFTIGYFNCPKMLGA